MLKNCTNLLIGSPMTRSSVCSKSGSQKRPFATGRWAIDSVSLRLLKIPGFQASLRGGRARPRFLEGVKTRCRYLKVSKRCRHRFWKMVIVSLAACGCCLRRQPAAPLVSGHTMKSMTEEPRKPPRFFTVEQVAEELSVGVPLVRGMLRTGGVARNPGWGQGCLADRDCRR